MNKEKYGFVYIWFDRKHKRYYIGAHWGSQDDNYICSSTWMRNSYKRRPNDFKRRILFKCNNKQDTFNKEYDWLCLIKQEELGKKYYNRSIINLHGNQPTTRIVSEETKKRMSESRKNNTNSLGSIRSEETKEKIRQKAIGRTHTEKTKLKYSETRKGENNAFYGKSHSEETKEKIRQSRLGKSNSPKTQFVKGMIPWNKGNID